MDIKIKKLNALIKHLSVLIAVIVTLAVISNISLYFETKSTYNTGLSILSFMTVPLSLAFLGISIVVIINSKEISKMDDNVSCKGIFIILSVSLVIGIGIAITFGILVGTNVLNARTLSLEIGMGIYIWIFVIPVLIALIFAHRKNKELLSKWSNNKGE